MYFLGAAPLVRPINPQQQRPIVDPRPPLPPVSTPRGWIQDLIVRSPSLAPTNPTKTSSDAFNQDDLDHRGGRGDLPPPKPSPFNPPSPYEPKAGGSGGYTTTETDNPDTSDGGGYVVPVLTPDQYVLEPAPALVPGSGSHRIGLAPAGFVALGIGLITLWAIFK